MSQIISVCGLICNECNFFAKECKGCYETKGATFWANEVMPDKLCPLYKCAVFSKEFNNCGECSELPCIIFNELKDPNISEEEHKKSLEERVSVLRKMQ